MTKTPKIIGTYVLVLLFSGPLSAQQTGEIRGRVADDKEEALPGVAITARSPSLQGIRSALSDKNGNFRLPLLPVGTYALNFELSGFEKVIVVDQAVRLGFTVDIPVILKLAALAEEITVTAPTPLIDKTKTDNSYRLNSDELAQIPSQARTITEVVGFTPGVTGVRVNTITGGGGGNTIGVSPQGIYNAETGAASFRGEGDSGNNWLIDGLSIKGAVVNDPGVQVNFDAWEEVQIVSDGFAPEMGQGMGGFINVVTKSGGNDFHGEIGGLIRDPRLRAARKEQLSAATVPETSLGQYFGNLGGPILKDKLWFFLSDNFFRTQDRTTAQQVGWLTIPAGKKRVSTNNAFGKLTYTPWRNHTVSLSGMLDKFLDQSGGTGVPETYSQVDYTNFSYRLNYRGILSPDTLLTAVFGQNRRTSDAGPLSGDYGPPAQYWMDIAQMTNNTEAGWSSVAHRTDAAADLTRYFDFGRWGNHELKAGASYYRNSFEAVELFSGRDFDPWPGNGFDLGAKIIWASPGIPLQLTETGPSEYGNSSRGFGLYVQDNFTAGHFSVMLGLRSDTQKVFNDRGELGWSWGIGDFLQPRASLVFDVSGDGRNLLKFSYGRYAQPISLLPLSFLINKTLANSFRLYEWIGSANPVEAQLKDPANWLFFFEQSPSAWPFEIDPNLKPNKMNKFLLEFDRRLGPNWALKLRGILSSARNLLNPIGIYDPQAQGGVRYQYTNFELKKRDYKALEVELAGRISGRFTLNASYTWSQAKGTATTNSMELFIWDIGWGEMADFSNFGSAPLVPDGAPDKEFIDALFHGLGGRGIGYEGWYGFLPYSVDHVIKVLGTCQAPYGFVVSSGIEFLSGYHWEKKGWSDVGAFLLFPEGRGSRTTPAHLYVDIAVEKDFSLKNGITLGLGISGYNLLNSQRPVSYMKADNEVFGQVWARQLPRWVQVKMTLRF